MVRKSAPEAIVPVFEAAREIQEFLRKSRRKFCFIGGIALQRWGEPRITVDVDVTLLAPLGEEARTVDLVLGKFAGRVPAARRLALERRVILARTTTGIELDVALGALDYEGRCVDRASDFRFGPGLRLRVCSAEDLVILKAFAGRDKDWVDLRQVLVRQRRKLKWKLIEDELAPLLGLKEAPGNLETLRKLKASVEKGE